MSLCRQTLSHSELGRDVHKMSSRPRRWLVQIGDTNKGKSLPTLGSKIKTNSRYPLSIDAAIHEVH